MLFWNRLCLLQFSVLLVIYTWLGLTSDPGNYTPMYNDKIMHCGGYFIAAFSISFAFPRWNFFYRALFLILFSIGIEIGQHFMPPRTFDFWDILANSTGVVAGLLLISLLEKNLSWFNRFLYLSQKQSV